MKINKGQFIDFLACINTPKKYETHGVNKGAGVRFEAQFESVFFVVRVHIVNEFTGLELQFMASIDADEYIQKHGAKDCITDYRELKAHLAYSVEFRESVFYEYFDKFELVCN